MLCTMPLAIIGYAVIANINDHPNVKYGMTFLMAVGIYSSVPPVLAWLANNSAGHYKRATAAAVSWLWPTAEESFLSSYTLMSTAPLYHRGHTVILALLVGGWFS